MVLSNLKLSSSFHTKLKSIQLQTFVQGQTATLAFEQLFAEQRVLIFSQPQIANSYPYLKRFEKHYNDFVDYGIDNLYVINSDSAFICPYIAKLGTNIQPLFDANQDFLSLLAQEKSITPPVQDLKLFWQYTVIINDGRIEQFWHNPIKANMSWRIYKNVRYQHHGLGPEPVLEYLVDNKTNNK